MEEGSLRCDANVSVRPSETAPFGTKVEIKNLNSIRFVAKAIEHEIERQAEALARGEKIVQETRLWDEKAGRTRPMRGKEEAMDYRYFPEPDLGLLVVDDAWLARGRVAGCRSCRRRARARFVQRYGLSLAGRRDARLAPASSPTTSSRPLKCPVLARSSRRTGSTGEVLRFMNERRSRPRRPRPSRLAGAPRGPPEARRAGTISAASAKEVFAAMLDSPAEAEDDRGREGARPRSRTRAPSRRPSRRSSPPTRRRSRSTAPARPQPSAGSSARS